MTKKDFELIANTIKLAYTNDENQDYKDGVRDVAMLLGHTLKQTNPAFDSLRFLAACEVNS